MEKKLINIGKETLAYLDEGQGDVVLMIHGNMSSSVHYSPLIQRLCKEYRCIALDLRGFGDSSYNQRFDTLEELADDVNLFLEGLGIESVYLVGWSNGGGVGLKLCAKYPNRVKKFFDIEGAGLMGYPLYKKTADLKSTQEPYATKEEMALDPMQVGPMLSVFEKQDAAMMTAVWNATIYTVNKPTREENDLWMAETLKQRNLLDLDWALANLNMSDRFTPYGKGDGSIQNVQCPCAFTTADQDIVVPGYMVMDNYNALQERSILIPYVDCGHSPMVDCPDRLAEDVRRFFS